MRKLGIGRLIFGGCEEEVIKQLEHVECGRWVKFTGKCFRKETV